MAFSKKIKNNKKLFNVTKSNMPFNNIEKFMKHTIYVSLAFLIINIIYISSVIYYLNNLKDCACYEVKNKINYSNITYLIVIESILLIINVIGLVGMIGLLSNLSSLKNLTKGITINKLSNKINKSSPGMHIYSILMLVYAIVYGYFIYYTYKVHENVDDNCKCTQSWLRYLLYIQAILMAIGIVNFVVVLFQHMM